MITLEVNGNKYTGFTDIEVRKSIELVSSAFSFSATVDDINSFPIKYGQQAKVYVNDIPIANGYINVVMVDYDSENHSITVNGRDKTCDLIDSTLKSNIEFNTGITLENIIKRVLADLNLTDIKIINNVRSIAKFGKDELVSGEINSKAFEFIETYCRLRQVLCTSDGEGNIVLTRGEQDLLPVKLLNLKNSQNNNIKSGNVTYSDINRFYNVSVYSQDNPSAFDFSVDNLAKKTGYANDSEIRRTRNINIIAEHSSSNFTGKQRAIWEVNIRRLRGVEYSVVVQGHTLNEQSQDIWEINKLVQVQDEFADINSQMLIRECVYRVDIDSGTTTTLSLVPKDAYQLQANFDEVQQRANIIAKNLKNETTI